MTYFKRGSWNALCDICGFEYKSDQLRENWKGQRVCQEDFEHRNPQDFLRPPMPRPPIPWTRGEGPPQWVPSPTPAPAPSSGSYILQEVTLIPLLTELGDFLSTET